MALVIQHIHVLFVVFRTFIVKFQVRRPDDGKCQYQQHKASNWRNLVVHFGRRAFFQFLFITRRKIVKQLVFFNVDQQTVALLVRMVDDFVGMQDKCVVHVFDNDCISDIRES